MKKLLAIFMVLVLAASVLPVFAAEESAPGTVEIQFCVGDSTLLINGEEVAVETPYVVGDGVTLVPLRVITEAFGATVGWIEETQTITLSYPDVEIVLQIGNPIAEVNGVAETLLAAPELPGDSTMVPLRFISETFGATVSYDEATERITVTKSASNGGETISDSAIDSAKVGDSYFGWSMDNPKDFVMEDRTFDGVYTGFVYDQNNWFDISIEALSEDFNFDKYFNEAKAALSSMTLVKADKGTLDNGVQYMHFQAKDKIDFWNIVAYFTDTRAIMLDSNFEIENAEICEKGIQYMDSFTLDFNTEDDIYDLSNVEDGYRTFESEALKLSFKVPADMIMVSDEETDGSYEFETPDYEASVPTISFAVFSKSDEIKDAFSLALNDFAHNKKFMNEKLCEFSTTVTERAYPNFKGYEYSINCTLEKEPFVTRDVFFEIGEYVYNMRIDLPLTTDNQTTTQQMNTLFNSITAEELDPNEVGILLRNFPATDETYEEKLDGYTLQLPVSVSNISNIYLDTISGLAFMINGQKASAISKKTLTENVNAQYSFIKTSNMKAIVKPTVMELGSQLVGYFVVSEEEDGEYIYNLYYTFFKDGMEYKIIGAVSELTYSEGLRDMIEQIIVTVETTK